MKILAALLLAAATAAQGPTGRHLTVEQQRDYWRVISEANAAQVRYWAMHAQLTQFCGGGLAQTAEGQYDCTQLPTPPDSSPKKEPIK